MDTIVLSDQCDKGDSLDSGSDYDPIHSESDILNLTGKKRRKLMPKKISYDGDDMTARYMHLRE
eukprot:4598478-Ditylum_brightwellii.AAC.1